VKRVIFLSYSSPQADEARRIELALLGEGHTVFRDRSALRPGETFDSRIRAAIDDSDLFVFLISPASIVAGQYTLTELEFAQQKWRHPSGHVLPVLVEPTPKAAIPEYLRAVTMLQPSGDLAAEVTAAVDRLTAPWWRWLLRPRGVALLVVIAVLAVLGVWEGGSRIIEHGRRNREAVAIVKQAELQVQGGNYAAAWDALQKGNAAYPDSAAIVAAQEAVAMQWLENARGSQLTGNLKDIADAVLPVLSRGATAHTGQGAADLLAHMGWAEFLRAREGVGGIDPTQHYRHALAIDPGNVYAHTMWAFEILRNNGTLAEAKPHVAAALAAGRARPYVRQMQIAALLWVHTSNNEDEIVRVANDMRLAGEVMQDAGPRSDPERLWSIYTSRLIYGNDKAQFLAALSPADHLATFRWLYPEDTFPKETYLYTCVLAQLQENAGDTAAALATYRRVLAELAARGVKAGRIVDDATAAVTRLSR